MADGEGRIVGERAGHAATAAHACSRLYGSPGFSTLLEARIDPARLGAATATGACLLAPRPDPMGPRGLIVMGIAEGSGAPLLLIQRLFPGAAGALVSHAITIDIGAGLPPGILSAAVGALDYVHFSGGAAADPARLSTPVEIVAAPVVMPGSGMRNLSARLAYALAGRTRLVLTPDLCPTESAFIAALDAALAAVDPAALTGIAAQSGLAAELAGLRIIHEPVRRLAGACVAALAPRQRRACAAARTSDPPAGRRGEVIALRAQSPGPEPAGSTARTPGQAVARPQTAPSERAARMDITRAAAAIGILADRRSALRSVMASYSWLAGQAQPVNREDWEHLCALPKCRSSAGLIALLRRGFGDRDGVPAPSTLVDIDRALAIARLVKLNDVPRRRDDGLLTAAADALIALLKGRTYLTPSELAEVRDLPDLTIALAELARYDRARARALFIATSAILAHINGASVHATPLLSWAVRARLSPAAGEMQQGARLIALAAVIADPLPLGADEARRVAGSLARAVVRGGHGVELASLLARVEALSERPIPAIAPRLLRGADAQAGQEIQRGLAAELLAAITSGTAIEGSPRAVAAE